MANVTNIELCNVEVGISQRRNDKGKILKSVFMIGPSKAVIQHGKITDEGSSQHSNNQNQSASNNANNSNDQAENSVPHNNQSENGTSQNAQPSNSNNSSFIRQRSYSILEAYSNMRLLYEDDTQSENDLDNVLTGAARNQPKQNSNSNNNNNSDNTADSDNSDNKSDTESDKQDNKQDKKSDNKPDEEDDQPDPFQEGTKYTFRVVLENEGYTEWTVVFDKNCKDVDAAKNAIRAKKFKQAFNMASEGLESDGLVPIKLATYVNYNKDGKESPFPPPFIGHCRYGFDSGSDEGNEDSRTICLAVAPILGKTNKPKQDYVIQAVYDVVGDITGGTLGKLSAFLKSAGKAAVNKITGSRDYDRWDDSEDPDSEQSISDELSKFLKSKFKCVGDHTMYANFEKIKKWIAAQVEAKNLKYSVSQSTKLDKFAIALKNNIVYF